MKHIKLLLIIFFLILFLISFFIFKYQNRNYYRYRHVECTGPNDFIEHGKTWVNFYFSKDSNKKAIESFKALSFNIKHDWTKNKIFFIGKFTGEIKKDIELHPDYWERLKKINKNEKKVMSGTPPDNLYSEFKLENWYIKMPFREWKETDDYDIIFIKRKELKPKDFEPFNKDFILGKHIK